MNHWILNKDSDNMDIRETIMRITKSINTDFVKENGYMDITYGGLVIGRNHGKKEEYYLQPQQRMPTNTNW